VCPCPFGRTLSGGECIFDDEYEDDNCPIGWFTSFGLGTDCDPAVCVRCSPGRARTCL